METVAFIAIATSAIVMAGSLLYAFLIRKKELEVFRRETSFVEKIDHMQHESEHMHDKSQHLIQHARDTAQRILEDAMTRSGAIIKQSDEFQQEIQQETRSTFLEASYEYSKKFESELKEMIVNFKKLFEESEKNTVEATTRLLEEQKVLSAQLLKQHLENQLKSADQELNEHKELEKKRISDRANAAVANIVKSVVGSSFTADDHEQLIKNALEQAKQEGLFDV